MGLRSRIGYIEQSFRGMSGLLGFLSKFIKGEKVNKKYIIILSGSVVCTVFLIACLSWLRFRNFRTVPFEKNGTKPAVLFLDRGTAQAHDPEYVAVTRMTVDGEIRRPVFRPAVFTGKIEVDYFREQDIVQPNAAKKAESMSERDEITEIWMRLRSNGEGSHAVPSVDLKYYFKSGSENEIVCLSYSDWRDRTEKIWWAVAGTEDAEQARAVLEKFFDARRAQGW